MGSVDWNVEGPGDAVTLGVAPFMGSVDWNKIGTTEETLETRRSLHGERGLKPYGDTYGRYLQAVAPFMGSVDWNRCGNH